MKSTTDAPTDSLVEQAGSAASTEAPTPNPTTDSPTASPTGPKKKCRRRLKPGHKGPGGKNKPGHKGPKDEKPGAKDQDNVGTAEEDEECV